MSVRCWWLRSSLALLEKQGGGLVLLLQWPDRLTIFVRMEVEVGYEYRLSAMVGRYLRHPRDGETHQNTTRSSTCSCCSNQSFSSARFREKRSFWMDNLDFEHRVRERTPCYWILAGWHNDKIFPIRPAPRSRLFAYPWTITCFFSTDIYQFRWVGNRRRFQLTD